MKLHHLVLGALLVLGSTSVAKADSFQNLEAKALSGDAKAQFELAKLYEEGRFGLEKNFSYALSWYEEAARNGLKIAVYRLKMLSQK